MLAADRFLAVTAYSHPRARTPAAAGRGRGSGPSSAPVRARDRGCRRGTRRSSGGRPRSASASSRRCAHEREVDAGARAASNAVAHRLRPVLVVAGDDHEPVAEQLARVEVGVDVGRVGDVVPVLLEEVDERQLVRPRSSASSGRTGGRTRRACTTPLHADARRFPVQAEAAPAVVRLPRVDRGLDEDRRLLRRPARGRRTAPSCRGPRRRRSSAGARRGSSRSPSPRHADRVGDGQPAPRSPSPIGQRDRLRLPARPCRPPAGTPAGVRRSAVPAEPVDLDAVARGGRRRDVQVDRVARRDADLGRVALDRSAERPRDAPARRSRAGVFALDRVQPRRRPPSSRRAAQRPTTAQRAIRRLSPADETTKKPRCRQKGQFATTFRRDGFTTALHVTSVPSGFTTAETTDVYSALDRQLGRKVAIKILSPRAARDEQLRAWLRREAMAVARLSHVLEVVSVYDVGDWRGRPYMAMEYLGGGSLASRARARPRHGRPGAALALAGGRRPRRRARARDRPPRRDAAQPAPRRARQRAADRLRDRDRARRRGRRRRRRRADPGHGRLHRPRAPGGRRGDARRATSTGWARSRRRCWPRGHDVNDAAPEVQAVLVAGAGDEARRPLRKRAASSSRSWRRRSSPTARRRRSSTAPRRRCSRGRHASSRRRRSRSRRPA